jgi:hypothetical protein
MDQTTVFVLPAEANISLLTAAFKTALVPRKLSIDAFPGSTEVLT